MGYNHFIEEKHFKEEWSKLEKQYEEAGMSKEIIHEMYQYDRAVFNSERRFFQHTEIVEIELTYYIEETNSKCHLYKRNIERFSSTIDSVVQKDRMAWIDEIEDENIARALKEMKYEDLDILTMLVFEGYKSKEIAEEKGISPQAISKKISKLKNFLKNF